MSEINLVKINYIIIITQALHMKYFVCKFINQSDLFSLSIYMILIICSGLDGILNLLILRIKYEVSKNYCIVILIYIYIYKPLLVIESNKCLIMSEFIKGLISSL